MAVGSVEGSESADLGGDAAAEHGDFGADYHTGVSDFAAGVAGIADPPAIDGVEAGDEACDESDEIIEEPQMKADLRR